MKTSSTSPPSFASGPGLRLGDSAVHAWWTGRAEGDQRALRPGGRPPAPLPHTLKVARLRQVHGAAVVMADDATADAPAWRGEGGDEVSLVEGDALVATGAGWCLAVLTADCGAVALASSSGAYAAVHVGWRGLLAGVLENAVVALRALRPDGPAGIARSDGQPEADTVIAALGPCIGPCCYEFSPADLTAFTAVYGAEVQATTSRHRPSLDLPGAVAVALRRQGVELVSGPPPCTACGPGSFSWRAARHQARQALLVWRAASP